MWESATARKLVLFQLVVNPGDADDFDDKADCLLWSMPSAIAVAMIEPKHQIHSQ